MIDYQHIIRKSFGKSETIKYEFNGGKNCQKHYFRLLDLFILLIYFFKVKLIKHSIKLDSPFSKYDYLSSFIAIISLYSTLLSQVPIP